MAPSDELKGKGFQLMAGGSFGTLAAEVDLEASSDSYQSEAQLEEAFIGQLARQGYERLSITCEADLIANLRAQLEKLNGIGFSDAEWERFFTGQLSNANLHIAEKTAILQEAPVLNMARDDGTTKNVTLLDKADMHRNSLQVINQYEADQGTHENRYDVTILVNGLPMVHVELKRRGVDIKEAFNQIERYQRESFWSGSGLFEWVQVFVISNGTYTKYYSNTTRMAHIKEATGKPGRKKTSHSFEFTSWWALQDNTRVTDLVPFTKTFFARRTILAILTRYCVLTEAGLLLVMRPYQIAATEKVLERIQWSECNKELLGTVKAGGYIWHTTGSGKTLTSFKCSQMAKDIPGVDKVLFVVDRKDLDYQAVREYEKFQRGAVNASKNTAMLERNLNDASKPVIVTTIQKLAVFIKKNPKHAVYSQHVVFIFDECHRSQFGEMHKAITKHFKAYHLFGFTGTPIFAENASSGGDVNLRTTEQAFGDRLHTYTIVDACTDGNVLPFRIDYVNTVAAKEGVEGQVYGIDTESALLAPERIRNVVAYILDHYSQKTKGGTRYKLEGRFVAGFNSMLACQSIPAAKLYYTELRRQLAERGSGLKCAVIYSFAPNEAEADGLIADEGFEPDALDTPSREFLDAAIADYNAMFGTSYDTSSEGFDGYYKDVSKRMKNRDLDILVVVGMFLTGFDATTLNTLWVDKNLKMHGLIQAFSRTNRILNSVKTFGNIVCFRDLEERVDEAVSMFGDADAGGVVLLRPYAEYLAEYLQRIAELKESCPADSTPNGEEAMREFAKSFGAILRLRNILTCFDEFADDDPASPREVQDWTSTYLHVRDVLVPRVTDERENIAEDLVFEMELVKQVEVNVDYILMLVERYRDQHGQDREVLADIERAIASSPSLRDKKDLIDAFIAQLNHDAEVRGAWDEYVAERRRIELDEIITVEHLRPELTYEFVEGAFDAGEVNENGTDIDAILPPLNPFSKAQDRAGVKRRVIEKLKAYLQRFINLGR